MKIMNYLQLLLFGAVLFSCKPSTEILPGTSSGLNTYMAGCTWASPTALARATYWKNGIPVFLTDGTQTAVAYAITVSGNDVFVAGSEGNAAVYWKNGVRYTLAPGSPSFTPCEATSITVVGTDVYVAGTITGQYPASNQPQRIAAYWKNGQQINLTSAAVGSVATSIAVSGNDVYVTGQAWELGKQYEEATYWKNGNPVYLSDGITTDAVTTGIAVSGTDVYISGSIIRNFITQETNQPKYWLNGAIINLGGVGEATDIAISGEDVYVSGSSNGKALYWKNASPILLQGMSTQGGFAIRDIAVAGSEVYIAGLKTYVPGSMFVKCWKNNNVLLTIDSTKQSWVKAVCVSKY